MDIYIPPFADSKVNTYGEYVYHYTSAENALLYILPQRRLRFSFLNNTNDPRERGLRILRYDGEAWLNCCPNRRGEIEKIIWDNIRVLCFSQDDPPKLNDTMFFEKGCEKFRMWAQYGNNHKGVCLVFKKDRIIEQFNHSFANIPHFYSDVTYHTLVGETAYNDDAYEISYQELLKSNEEIATERIGKYYQNYYFTKSIDWQSENEFRLAIQFRDSEFSFLNIDGILEAIVLGAYFDKSLMPLIELLTHHFENKPEIFDLFLFNKK